MPHRAQAFLQRHPARVVAVALLAVYAATLAPTVTLWDSGEFLSAVRTLGVPHPPGTPLFIHLARAWASALGLVDFTLAVNAGSAMATAIGVSVLARTFAMPLGSVAVVLAGLVAGLTASVWQSATETEVYGYALCLAALTLRAADHAGPHWSMRHRVLVAFLFGLAVPLHISALVAGPAAILLASTDAGGSLSLRAVLAPSAAWFVAVGVGTMSPGLVVLGGIVAGVAALAPAGFGARASREAAAAVLVAILGATFTVAMLVRARHDPGVNQGHPSTWGALFEVIGRAQYDVPPLWPRRAPAWLQVGNVVQYADWQFALGIDGAPGASWLRTPVTLVFALLGLGGAMAHRRADRRSFRGLALLFAGASLGVVAILNLRAGPSYGFGVLPEGTLREARERDYFFGMAFACWGLWCGLGLATLRHRVSRRLGVATAAVAMVPLALNWNATNRRRHPDAVLARVLGISTLDGVPRDAVMLLAGDNDSYAVWWAQRVQGTRPDVVPVTVPLLGADWYREELRRRFSLLDSPNVDVWRGTEQTLRAISRAADRAGRPLVAGVGLGKGDRLAMGAGWVLAGMTFRRDSGVVGTRVDTARAAHAGRTIRSFGLSLHDRDAGTPAGRYVQRLLRCPAAAVDGGGANDRESTGLLESTCNY